MTKFLFDDFSPISVKAWKQKIQVDLKGKDYNKTLLWKTQENIVVKPFYTMEDRAHKIVDTPKKRINICQSIFIDDEKIANQLAINTIKNGINTIEFIADSKFNIETALKNISLKENIFYFKFNFMDVSFIKEVVKHTNTQNTFFNIDIIGNLASTGNWFFNLKKDISFLKEIIDATQNSICVNASIYQNAGANITQQLAYALAHANEYLNYYGKEIASKIHFNFSIGSNSFFEIAKLRAFPILWNALLKEYGIQNKNTHLFSKPSLRNKTLYTSEINISRALSECMSAVLGSTDTVCNIRYDEIFHKSNKLADDISRNQLLMLKNDFFLDNSTNIANGTYYIESITNQLAENALEVFKQIENGGGFLKQLKEGVIQKKITESANKEQSLFDEKTLILVGTNKFKNNCEAIKNELELFPFVKKRHLKTLIQPIIKKRLAENQEQERLKNE